MEEKLDLEDRLKQCCDILDSCATVIRDYEVEPVQKNIESTKSAINEICDILLGFESFRETLKESWQPKCSFCKLKENQVATLIQGPGVLICNSCVELCVENLKSHKDYIENDEEISMPLPSHTTIGQIRKRISNHHFNTKVALRLTDESA